ncbi:DNA-binding protein WhiA [Alkalibaculum sp. M08DMB]|uniref:Probable cell division protein WhiA n=1 Tax=Alkalibaculum sporogenes TaxID=2655001 RepID=A0A6A7KAZ2_9FIRM|nr:DNA-binding protein WhiA [Alkalibaculum sporogenes]MPW26357.1 DNA-binding protein WhiA [Alkalibaculum sporogenes]
MSFSSETKSEICALSYDDNCCMLAELSSLFHMCGTISFEGNNKVSFNIRTENAAIARRGFKILKANYKVNAKVSVSKNRQFINRNVYTVKVPSQEETLHILLELHILKNNDGFITLDYDIPKKFTSRSCCKRAAIRGAFLGGGSISNPDKAYHLEFTCHNKEYAEQLLKLINSYNLTAKCIQRKNNYIVYLKEGEQIVTLLNIIGAHKTLLNIENIRIMKEMRNNVNRIVNCETANLTKTVDAAYRQIESIEYIKEHMGLEKLPQKLKEVAELRLNYEDASLKELGELLEPPVGKSGINHRFKKIEEIAKSIGLN